MIIATNFIGAREQLINNKNGIIVNYDKQDLLDAIEKLSNNKEFKNKLIYNLEREKDFNNVSIKTLF